MAKVKAKSKFTSFNKFLFIVFIVLLVATVLIVVLSSAKTATVQADVTDATDEVVIDEFKAGTYGGVEFKTQEDVVNYYVEAYNYSKSLTAQYKDKDGNTVTYYKLLGSEDLQIKDVLVEGSKNEMINKLVPKIASGLISKGLNGLPPSRNRNPELDNNSEDSGVTEIVDFTTSHLEADDILAANVKENSDGTITITMQPKMYNMSAPGMDCQGHMFTTLGDIGPTVDGISALSWSSGTTEENCLVNYVGGTATVTINPSTKEITEADYNEVAQVSVNHANVAVLKDKSASLTITFDVHFPADDQYLADSKGVTRL